MTLGEEYKSFYKFRISMVRRVIFYNKGEAFHTMAGTWEKSLLGYGSNEKITRVVEDGMDMFINEFYKANNF